MRNGWCRAKVLPEKRAEISRPMDSAAWATEVSRSEDLSCRGVSRKARRTTEREHYTRTVMRFSRSQPQLRSQKSGGPAGTILVLFSRLNDSRTAFDPQRDLMQYATGGDGGLSVAADARGDVYVVWHAMGAEPGEEHRRVYMARSTDDGKAFAREVPISPATLGACGCCGMRAIADERDTLYVLYRAAAESVHRDMTLLTSTDQGSTFGAARVDSWELNACPMSTAYLSEGGREVLAAWEKAGQVYFEEIEQDPRKVPPVFAAPGEGANRKHPAVAANANGLVLLVWTEGTGWLKGGSLTWQVFDSAGKATSAQGHAPGVPVWGLPSAFAGHQGNFTIVY